MFAARSIDDAIHAAPLRQCHASLTDIFGLVVDEGVGTGRDRNCTFLIAAYPSDDTFSSAQLCELNCIVTGCTGTSCHKYRLASDATPDGDRVIRSQRGMRRMLRRKNQ